MLQLYILWIVVFTSPSWAFECTGTYFLNQQQEAQQPCTHITDSLHIQARVLTDTLCMQLSMLNSIDGTLELSFIDELTSLSCLSTLHTLHTLQVRHNDHLTTLELPSLRTSIAALHIESCPLVTSLDPSLFHNVEQLDFLLIRDQTNLTFLTFPDLTQITTLSITQVPQLTDLSFPVLWHIAGSITLELDAMDHVNFLPRVRRVGGYLKFRDWTTLRNINALESIHDIQTNHALETHSAVCCPPRDNTLWENGWFDITCTVCIQGPLQLALNEFEPGQYFYFTHHGISTSLQYPRTLVWNTFDHNTTKVWPMTCESFTAAGIWCLLPLRDEFDVTQQSFFWDEANITDTFTVFINKTRPSSSSSWIYELQLWSRNDVPQWLKDNEWIQNSSRTNWKRIDITVFFSLFSILLIDVLLACYAFYLIRKGKVNWLVLADFMNYHVEVHQEWDVHQRGTIKVDRQVLKTSCGGLMTAIKHANTIIVVMAYHYYHSLNEHIHWSDLQNPTQPYFPQPHTLTFELALFDWDSPCELSKTQAPEYPAGGFASSIEFMTPLHNLSTTSILVDNKDGKGEEFSWEEILQLGESRCSIEWKHVDFSPVYDELAQTQIVLPVNSNLTNFGWRVNLSNGQSLWGAQQHNDKQKTNIILGWSIVEEQNEDESIHEMSSLRVLTQVVESLPLQKNELEISSIGFSIQLDSTIARIEEERRKDIFETWMFSLLLGWISMHMYDALYTWMMWSRNKKMNNTHHFHQQPSPQIEMSDFEWNRNDWHPEEDALPTTPHKTSKIPQLRVHRDLIHYKDEENFDL